MIRNMVGETERHLTKQHGSCHRASRELIVNRGEAFGRILWPSSIVEQKRLTRDLKCRWGKGGIGGLTDVDSGGMT